jgi:hypothetical protein
VRSLGRPFLQRLRSCALWRGAQSSLAVGAGDFGPHEGSFWLREDGSCPCAWDFALRAGNFGLRAEDLGSRARNFKLRAGNFGSREEDFGPRAGDFESRAGNFELRAEELGAKFPSLRPKWCAGTHFHVR